MENENNIKKRIDELKITEEDLYFLSHIEGIKSTAGIFKEKYNKYMYGILKKNNINSIDFLMISRYVKNKKFHLMPELIEKYGPYQLDSSKTSYDFKGMKAFAIVLIAIIVGFFVFKQTNNSSNSLNSIETIEGTKKCLVGYDWVYPSGNNPSGAWKFSSDGAFNSSTTMFGGMSTWGNWKIISPGKINVSYTRTSEGTIPNDQVLTLSGCSSLSVGSTTYVKD
jgi:hypothetical protein